MKAVVLAAGFGVRLGKLGVDKPKSLIDINQRTILDNIIDKIKALDVDNIYLITNNVFIDQFEAWNKDRYDINILNNGVNSVEERKGAIGDLLYLIEKKSINDDLIIIAGDNLFSFDLKDMINFFKQNKKPVIGVYDIKDKSRIVKKFGVVEVEDNKIIKFKEKPQSLEETTSTLISTLIYLFPKETINLIREYRDKGYNLDRAGDFIAWLSDKEEVLAYVFDEGKWFDIGNSEDLKQAEEDF